MKDVIVMLGGTTVVSSSVVTREHTDGRLLGVQMKGMQQAGLLVGVLGTAVLLASMGRPDVQEVSFQHFRTHLLANGMVDHIEVSKKSTAKVFVRPNSQRCVPRAFVWCSQHVLASAVLLSVTCSCICTRTSLRRRQLRFADGSLCDTIL